MLRAIVVAVPWLVGILLCSGVASAQAPPTDHLIRFFQVRIASDPDDAASYNKLSAAYIQKARESGDTTYYDLAEKASTRSLALIADHPLAATPTLQLAIVRVARHQFADGRVQARKALALAPHDLSPHAVIGDASFELGDYDQAEASYAKLLALGGARHPHSRMAALHFVRGEPQLAIQTIQRAVRAVAHASLPRENVAWHHAQLAEAHFQVGALVPAEAALENALNAYPRYHRAVAGLAKVRAAQKRYEEAAGLYEKAIAVIPLPEYAAALGDVLTKTGPTAEAQKQYALVEYIGRLNAVNQVLYNRELALFYADRDRNLPAALELARRELDVRRDVYSYDVLAWALLKNGRAPEALVAMREALRHGTKDARLYFHAGMIYRAIGDRARAREYLERSLATNPHFDLLQSEVAAQALAELRQAPGPAGARSRNGR